MLLILWFRFWNSCSKKLNWTSSLVSWRCKSERNNNVKLLHLRLCQLEPLLAANTEQKHFKFLVFSLMTLSLQPCCSVTVKSQQNGIIVKLSIFCENGCFQMKFSRVVVKINNNSLTICSNLYPSRKFIDDPAINFQTHRGHVDYVTIGVFFFADFFSNYHSPRMFNKSLLDGETIRLFQWTVWHDPRARIWGVSLEFAVLLLRISSF